MGAARAAQLSINTRACDQISRLAETLFVVEEVAEAAAGVHPLTRREGGVIGSAANLTGMGGVAVRSVSPASCLPSLLFVSDWAGHRVQAFDVNSGAFICSIGTGVEVAEAGQFSGPEDVGGNSVAPRMSGAIQWPRGWRGSLVTVRRVAAVCF